MQLQPLPLLRPSLVSSEGDMALCEGYGQSDKMNVGAERMPGYMVCPEHVNFIECTCELGSAQLPVCKTAHV